MVIPARETGESGAPTMRVVVLTACYGSLGHRTLARNYCELLASRFAVTMLDVTEKRGPGVDAAAAVYRTMLRQVPDLWRFVYTRWQDIPGLDILRRHGLAPFFKAAGREAADLRPQLVISTHSHTTALAVSWKAQGLLDAPLVVALSDWHFQPSWCFPGVDHYLASSTGQHRQLLAAGVPEERITVSGLLVSPAFRQGVGRQRARRQLQLADGPTILVMGGGEGWFLEEMLDTVARLRTPVFCIAICGSERRAAESRRFLARRASLQGRTRVLAFVDEPALYLGAADLVISKVGAMTAAEAFAVGTPLLAVRAVPGHEEAGLAALVREEAVLPCERDEDLPRQIDNLLASPAQLKLAAWRGTELMSLPTEAIILEGVSRAISREACVVA